MSLKIMSLNMFWGDGYCSGWYSYLFKIKKLFHNAKLDNVDRIIDVVNTHDPDILCVQEICRSCSPDDFQDHVKEILKKTKLKHYEFGAERKKYWKDGNAIFSKQKPESTTVHTLDSWKEPRCYIDYAIRYKNKTITIINTHFSAMILLPHEREKQAQQLINHMQTISAPIILCGDFNAGLHSKVQHELSQVLKSLNKHKTFPAYKPKKEFDQIFVSHEIKNHKIKVLLDKISDHRGLILELS